MNRARSLVLLVMMAWLPSCDPNSRTREPNAAGAQATGAVLAAPSGAHPHDLDLHLHWREASVVQRLPPLDQPSAFRQNPEVVTIDGEAHRALLLLPSLGGVPSVARFRVRIVDACELVTWTALDPLARDPSDGVEFGIGVGADSDPNTVAVRYERLRGGKSPTWRPVRLDLTPFRGQTVWIVLATRDADDRRGDRLLFGDPRIRLIAPTPEAVTFDLTGPGDPGISVPRFPWSEVNLYKPYYTFKDEDAGSKYPKSIATNMPWARSLRLFSSLGANWGPTLERDYEAQMGMNPSTDSSRERHWAQEYEFFRDGPVDSTPSSSARFDWSSYDRMLDHAAATGLGLHLHMAGAPERFTGRRGSYPSHHYNELPVVDGAGWKGYVESLFAHLADKPWFTSAHVSFFSEPNCMWVEYDGSVRHLGFQGNAEEYARQYLWTWQAMRGYVRPGQVHLGPWVVEPDPANPAVNNLGVFLRALRAEFVRAGEPLPPWSAFAFNVYETPQLALENVAEYKLAHVRRVLSEEFPDLEVPLRFDEVGIHPLVSMSFERATGVSLTSTRWAAAWTAEMLALLIDERIQQASPWYVAEDTTPYVTYIGATYVMRALEITHSPDGRLEPRDIGNPGAMNVHVRLASQDVHRVGSLWTTDARTGSVRVLVWHLPRFPVTDERLDRDEAAQPVIIRLPPVPKGWRVTAMAPRGARLPSADVQVLPLGATGGARHVARAELTATDSLTFEIAPAGLLIVAAEPIQ